MDASAGWVLPVGQLYIAGASTGTAPRTVAAMGRDAIGFIEALGPRDSTSSVLAFTWVRVGRAAPAPIGTCQGPGRTPGRHPLEPVG